ncbi:MAG: T9SS type A sorting domain-containing protein [Bacteroidetes bacterium]|nr:T9SS type A sorting domain-containing protein [Bacteroidota bacterium]
MNLKITLFFILMPLLAVTQTVSTISANSGVTDDLIFDADGNLLGADYSGSAIYRISLPDGASSIFADGFNTPNGLAFDHNGLLYMADNIGNKVYKIFPDGSSEVFASIFNPSGLIYYPLDSTILATSYQGDRIFKITLNGDTSTFAAGGYLSGAPVGMDYDENGNLYVGNFDNTTIVKLLPNGEQELITFGPGGGSYQGFIAYSSGYIYGTMFNKNKLFRTDLQGNYEIYLGSTAGSVDGDANVAKFNRPNGIVASPNGDTLYVSDYTTSNIRMITNLEGNPSGSSEVLQAHVFSISPNPVGEMAVAIFELAHPATASLAVYDQKGRIVNQVLENESLGVGSHQVEVTTAQLPAGIYHAVLRLDDGQEVLTRKLVRM